MNKVEINKLFEIISIEYGNFNVDADKYKYWADFLEPYSFEDVKTRFYELRSQREYTIMPPSASVITRGLTKVNNKIKFDEITFTCQFCHRFFNTYDDMVEHEERCRSVRYIERQYKRFNLNNGNVDKASLYNMPQDEFDSKYRLLLKKVQELTNDAREKQIIENIFNPPKMSDARKMLYG